MAADSEITRRALLKRTAAGVALEAATDATFTMNRKRPLRADSSGLRAVRPRGGSGRVRNVADHRDYVDDRARLEAALDVLLAS
jgi:hypothetical protein